LQRQASARIRASGIPGREALLDVAMAKRLTSAHAWYRAISAARTATMAQELPVAAYNPRAARVLASGDAHLYQPTAARHSKQSLMLSIGDSDRIGLGPYEWDVRSQLISIELEGRVRGFTSAKRQAAMTAFLEAYRRGINQVANASDAEAAAGALRLFVGDAPPMVLKFLAASLTLSRNDWLDERVQKQGDNAEFKTKPQSLEHLPNKPKGAAARIRKALAKAASRYADALYGDARDRLKNYKLVDVAMPYKGNGSLGYGRYYALLVPGKGLKHLEDAVILEFKEQLPCDLSLYVDASDTEAKFGRHQGERAVALMRLGSGAHAVPSWSHTELPAGCGVVSSHFTIKEVDPTERGFDPSMLNAQDFQSWARINGQLMAAFQTLAGTKAPTLLGGACDIAEDMANKPNFDADNLNAAVRKADDYEREFKILKASAGQ